MILPLSDLFSSFLTRDIIFRLSALFNNNYALEFRHFKILEVKKKKDEKMRFFARGGVGGGNSLYKSTRYERIEGKGEGREPV